jgi:prevent-host-death family protein
MNKVSIRDARRLLTAIVDAAEHGQSTIITRRGRQVARVAPMKQSGAKPLPDLADFRASISVKGKPLSRVVIDRRKEARY